MDKSEESDKTSNEVCKCNDKLSKKDCECPEDCTCGCKKGEKSE